MGLSQKGATDAVLRQLVQDIHDGVVNLSIESVEAFNTYVVYTGTGADTYTAINTRDLPVSYTRWDLVIETFAAHISFRMSDGSWGGDISLVAGMHSIDFASNGIRIKNRVAGSNCTYEITTYRIV